MNSYQSDRRLADRYKMKTPPRVRLWKSALPECTAESVNLSQRGIYFSTDSELRKGETVEVLFHMPEEIVGEPTGEWRCTGHEHYRDGQRQDVRLCEKLETGIVKELVAYIRSITKKVITQPAAPARRPFPGDSKPR
jgi:hypothetical protein